MTGNGSARCATPPKTDPKSKGADGGSGPMAAEAQEVAHRLPMSAVTSGLTTRRGTQVRPDRTGPPDLASDAITPDERAQWKKIADPKKILSLKETMT
jgi:hypothetical protein